MMLAGLLVLAALVQQDTLRPTLLVPGAIANDSVAVLGFDEFEARVLAHHPVARQAVLIEDIARAEVLAAKGGVFDPRVAASYARKSFDGTDYYSYTLAGLTVPTPIGIDFKLEYERTEGNIINPDRFTPPGGLVLAGVHIPIGSGLITDPRRQALGVAKALRDAAEADRQAAVNQLLYEAARDYAAWYRAWRRRQIAREGVQLADLVYRATQIKFVDGDAAAIDTVEAGLEVQVRRVALLDAENGWYAATQLMNTYLWDEGVVPVDIPHGVVPSLPVGIFALDSLEAERWFAMVLDGHPELARARARVREGGINRRFYAQDLVPAGFVEGYTMKEGGGGLFNDWGALADNYKYTVGVATPLLLMQGRGRLNAAGARLETATLDSARVLRDLHATVLAATFELTTIDQVLGLQGQAVAQARVLRTGEVRRFEDGESTIFLVNQRDRLLLDQLLKQADFEARFVASRAALAVALGQPGWPSTSPSPLGAGAPQAGQ